MPIYVYRCRGCGREDERFHFLLKSERDEIEEGVVVLGTPCQECGGVMELVMGVPGRPVIKESKKQ